MAAPIARLRTGLHHRRIVKILPICGWRRADWRCLFQLLGGSGDRLSHRDRRLVGFSQEQMFEVVSDTSRYPEFLPWCQRSRALAHHGSVEHVHMTVGFAPFEETYTSQVTRHEPHKIRSFSPEGTFFRDLESRWSFEARGRHSCILDFEVSFVLKSSLQAPLANMFLKTTATQMSRAFIERARQLYGEPSCEEKELSDLQT